MAAARSGPSLTGRFAAAIALTVGFYTLAVVMAAGLLALAILPWVLGSGSNIWISLTGLVLGVSILVAVFPRREWFEAPGVQLTADDQPRLLDAIAGEARACGEREPDEVYATFEVNAAVTEVGRRRRVMIVGLPLLDLVSERGLRGVIAHEFGHYAGGDTRLGPWIWRTRAAIVRTVEHLSDEDGDDAWSTRAVRAPFIWYGRAFLRITNAISRRQEFAADALAARHVGRDVYVEGLKRSHAYGPAFDAYWQQEVVAALEFGRRPPVSEGFSAFVRAEPIERAAGEQLEHELAERKTDPYDSHPSLSERIAAVQDCPAGEPDDSPPATDLVHDPDALEVAMLIDLFGPEAASELRPLRWVDAGREIYLERARALTGAHGELLAGTTVAELGDAATNLGPLIGKLQQRERELTPEAAPELAAALLAESLIVALEAGGWSIEAPPAKPVLACRGDARLAPHVLVGDLRREQMRPDDWSARATELGIADLPLHAPAPLTAV
jgi:heat shock protein HtpX